MFTDRATDSLNDIKLKPKELLEFTEQLDSFISAEMTLDQSLEKLREIYEDGSPGKPATLLVAELQMQILSGKKFSEALATFPRTFSQFYVSMISASELTGNLAEILRHLRDYLQREDDLKSEVKGALTYPIILLILGLSVTVFLLISIVPQFESMFQSTGRTLPVYTQILLEVSRFVGSYRGLLLLVALVLAGKGMRHYLESEKGRLWWDTWILCVPLLGPLVRKVAVARFTLTLGILLKSKVDLLPTLSIAQGVVGNKILADAVGEASLRVNAGENMTPSLRGLFPLKAVQMLEVGEANTQLGEMSLSVAVRYEKEVRNQLKLVTSALEPILLVVLGGIVCFIALAIFLPMMSQPQF